MDLPGPRNPLCCQPSSVPDLLLCPSVLGFPVWFSNKFAHHLLSIWEQNYVDLFYHDDESVIKNHWIWDIFCCCKFRMRWANYLDLERLAVTCNSFSSADDNLVWSSSLPDFNCKISLSSWEVVWCLLDFRSAIKASFSFNRLIKTSLWLVNS